MQVGDLVTMSPAVDDPEKYGIGLVEKIVQHNSEPSDATVNVRWSAFPEQPLSCGRFVLKLASTNRD